MLIENKQIKSILFSKVLDRINDIETTINNDIQYYLKNYASNDYEEILRILMVKYFPKLKSNLFTDKEVDIYYKLIFSIPLNLFITDIRFFDMYNNFYEHIEDKNNKDYQNFIVNYFCILQEYKKELK